jgi:predicted transposase YbfD/YdcC
MLSMLASMNIENAIITAVAIHCHTETRQLIREGKFDYVLPVKPIRVSYIKKLKRIFISLTVILLGY